MLPPAITVRPCAPSERPLRVDFPSRHAVGEWPLFAHLRRSVSVRGLAESDERASRIALGDVAIGENRPVALGLEVTQQQPRSATKPLAPEGHPSTSRLAAHHRDCADGLGASGLPGAIVLFALWKDRPIAGIGKCRIGPNHA